MKLGRRRILPISLFLDTDDYWKNRMEEGKKHFDKEGIHDILWINAIHAERFGVEAARVYDRDPQNIETGWKIPQRTVGNYLSWYMAFMVMKHLSWIDFFLIMEDDTRLNPDWIKRFEQALEDVPEDFDYLLLSHCCTEGRPTEHVKGEIFEVKYPQAGHFAVVARKAIPVILENCTNASYPFDVNLFDFAFPKLKVYTLLPRLAEQEAQMPI